MRWRYSGLGAATLAALSLFLLVRLGSTSATDGGAMALDCNASVIGVQSECSYSAGAEFSVDVYLLRAPAEGYVGFQTKVWWDPANVAYLPTQMLRAEALWPHCSIPARAENFDRETNQGQPSVLFGCVPFPLPLEPYHEAGRVLTFRFECQEDAYTDLYLIPRFGDGQLGTHFLDINLAPVDPELTGATVRCGNPPTPTPCGAEGCPTQTPRPRPPTPRPTATEWPTRTPIPPPDVDLESHCSPDAIRPDELALLTCEITVTNHDTIPAHGVRLHQYFYGNGGGPGPYPALPSTVRPSH